MTEIPDNATQPQDHQKPAVQAEAEDGTATISHGDLTFQVPADLEDLDGEFLKYAADQDGYRMVATVLDDKQFAAFRATKPSIRDYNGLSEQIAKVYGFADAGN